MLIDTHCHINMMIKKEFDVALTTQEVQAAADIIQQAADYNVTRIINVGTSLIESKNCVTLATHYQHVYAAVGIHPNDCTSSWMDDLKELAPLLRNKEQNKIVGIGETGLDRHYPDFNLPRQKDAFKAQIELALEYDLGLVVHTRDARDETLRSIEEFKGQIKRGVIHCFSEDQDFATQVIEWGLYIGIGGALTYPKNIALRDIVCNVSLDNIVLETDAPFLPPQSIRGKQNHPQQIATVADFIAHLRNEPMETVAEITTRNATRLFNIKV